MSTTKINLGIDNLKLMYEYKDNHEKLDKVVAHYQDLKNNLPITYKEEMKTNYYSLKDMNFFQMLFNVLLAYILFRLNYKVRPYDAD